MLLFDNYNHYYDHDLYLYVLGTRLYDPNNFRFVSPDRADVIFATPNGLTDKNLYAYCDNNPVMRVDHDGEFWLATLIGAAIGAVVGAVSSIVEQTVSDEKINWAEVGVAAASGALTGAITTANPAMGAVATGAIHGAVGAVTYVATELVNGETPTVKGVLVTGVTSGVLAGAIRGIEKFCATKYLNKIVKDPTRIQGQSLGKVKYAAELSPEWSTGTLSKGNHAGMGWKANSRGDWLIQWHPGGRWHFDGLPYWKVSSGANGTFRCRY